MFAEPEECEIAGHYLSALINGDYSGLNTDECAKFQRWVREAQAGRSGHWSYYSEDAEDENGEPNEEERAKAGEHWIRCEVTSLMAMCETVVFHAILENNTDHALEDGENQFNREQGDLFHG